LNFQKFGIAVSIVPLFSRLKSGWRLVVRHRRRAEYRHVQHVRPNRDPTKWRLTGHRILDSSATFSGLWGLFMASIKLFYIQLLFTMCTVDNNKHSNRNRTQTRILAVYAAHQYNINVTLEQTSLPNSESRIQ